MAWPRVVFRLFWVAPDELRWAFADKTHALAGQSVHVDLDIYVYIYIYTDSSTAYTHIYIYKHTYTYTHIRTHILHIHIACTFATYAYYVSIHK